LKFVLLFSFFTKIQFFYSVSKQLINFYWFLFFKKEYVYG